MSKVLRFPSNGRPERQQRTEHDTRHRQEVGPAPRLRTVIGDVLRDERLGQDRTLVDVAERAAVSVPYLSEVERGRKEVSSDVLSSICDALELPLVDVLDRSADRLRTDAHAQRRSGFVLLAA